MISGAGAMNPVCPREDGLPYGMPEEYAGGAMNLVCPREDGRLEWGNGVVSMLFDTAGDSPRPIVQRCRPRHGAHRRPCCRRWKNRAGT